MLELPTPPVWMADAACAQTGPDDHTWFPTAGPASKVARTVCGACPVAGDCLEFALTVEGETSKWHRSGIWGGAGPAERARIARQRRDEAAA